MLADAHERNGEPERLTDDLNAVAAHGDTIVVTHSDLGGAPFGVRRIDATVTLTLPGPAAVQAVALDENGYPTAKPVKVDRTGDTVTVRTPSGPEQLEILTIGYPE